MKPLTFKGIIRKPSKLGIGRKLGKLQMGGGRSPKPQTAQERLAEWDAMFCVVRFGGKTRIFTWEKSPVHRGAVTPVFYSKHELATYFDNEFATQTDAQGNSRQTSLFTHWMRQASTPHATGITLDPACGRFADGQLNLWCGFGKKSIAGTWPLLRTHIETVICNDHAPSIDYLLKWLAWLLQNPAEPSEVKVVLRGKAPARAFLRACYWTSLQVTGCMSPKLTT